MNNTINGKFVKNSIIYQKNNRLIKNKKKNYTIKNDVANLGNKNYTIKDAVANLGNKNYTIKDAVANLGKKNYTIKDVVANLGNNQIFEKQDGVQVKTNNQIFGKQDGVQVKKNNQIFEKQDGVRVKKNNQIFGKQDGVRVKKNNQIFGKQDGVQVKKNNQIFGKQDGVQVKTNNQIFGKQDGVQVKKNNQIFGKQDGVRVKTNNQIFGKQDGVRVKGDMDGFGKEKGNMNPRFVYLYKNKFEMEAVSNKYDMKGLSPLSGYEPNYNPNYWNNNKNIKNNNNCYSYSVNNKNHHFGKPQPGYFARFNHIQNNQYKCAYFFKRILNDIPSVYLTSFKQKCKKGFTKAFFAIDSNKNEHDYHFYRQDTNKLWSHKPGTTNVINYDANYKIIKNPYTANRNYTSYNYDKPCFFFCVNHKFGKTKAKI
jgi:hypothetical protein